MDIKLKFFFYLAAVVCFGLATAGTTVGRGRTSLNLTALGLALFVFPTMWDTGSEAF